MVMNNLFDDLEAAGFGHFAGYGRRRERVRTKTYQVTLPDGKTATRSTSRPCQVALAVHVTSDPVLGDYWTVFTWLVRSTALPAAIKNANRAGYTETQSLEVEEEEQA